MNNNPDIDKLFEAARRREADLRRQQQLSDMIDRMAESGAPHENENKNEKRKAENGERRRTLWPYIGIAASVLLLASVGLHILSQDSTSPSQQQLIAGTKPQLTTAVDSTAGIPATQTDVIVPVLKPHTSLILAQSEALVEVQSPESRQNEIEEKETAIETATVLPDEPLLAEETQIGDVETENESDASKGSHTIQPASPIVYERTSTRLVCGSGCRPEVRPSQDDTPLFAFTNISSTGTTIGIGGSAF